MCLKDPSYSETVAVFFHHIEATASYVYIVVIEIESLIKTLHLHCLMALLASDRKLSRTELIALSNSDRGCCLTFL